MFSLIALIGFPFLIWQAYKRARLSKASSTWPVTSGLVTVSERKKIGWRMQPQVSYRYEVAGKTYSSNNVTFANPVPARETETILSQHRLNQAVTVHYDPRDPSLAVLEPGRNRLITRSLRILVVWYVIIIFINVLNASLDVWLSTHSSDGPAARTYDDAAKADPQLGNRLLREDADKGNAQDQAYVAMWYLQGSEGYPQDQVEGAKWMRKSADQGNAGAENMMANLYARGTGVEKNPSQAIEWLRKAVAQGEPHACYSLGTATEKGLYGVTADRQQALELYRKAGDEPHAKAALARLGYPQ